MVPYFMNFPRVVFENSGQKMAENRNFTILREGRGGRPKSERSRLWPISGHNLISNSEHWTPLGKIAWPAEIRP